jgi:hypothetical protein
MRLWISDDHDSHYVGGASVVCANDEIEARRLLDQQLRQHGLKPEKGYTLSEISLDVPFACVIKDGDY